MHEKYSLLVQVMVAKDWEATIERAITVIIILATK
jgi:hypothetical protein